LPGLDDTNALALESCLGEFKPLEIRATDVIVRNGIVKLLTHSSGSTPVIEKIRALMVLLGLDWT